MAQDHSTSRIMITFAAFVVIVAGMRAASTIVVPLLLALFLAIICSGPVGWLRGKGVSSWLAILVVIFVILGIGSFVTGFLGASVTDFVKASPRSTAGNLGCDFSIRMIAITIHYFITISIAISISFLCRDLQLWHQFDFANSVHERGFTTKK